MRVPAMTEAMRQPNGSKPKSSMPPAISHFPSGGWTVVASPAAPQTALEVSTYVHASRA